MYTMKKCLVSYGIKTCYCINTVTVVLLCIIFVYIKSKGYFIIIILSYNIVTNSVIICIV